MGKKEVKYTWVVSTKGEKCFGSSITETGSLTGNPPTAIRSPTAERNENPLAVHHFMGDRLLGYAGPGIFAAGGHYISGESQKPGIRTGDPENMRGVLSRQREKGMAPCRFL